MKRNIRRILLALLPQLILVFFDSVAAEARITRVVIQDVSSVFENNSFGQVGQYELITGCAFGELDPEKPENAIIQDIALAPHNVQGMIEYVTPFQILKPRKMARSNGVLLYDVVNRGYKTALSQFNQDAVKNNFVNAGDGFLEARGYTVLWSGWEGDVTQGSGRLGIDVPIAKNPDGSEITGRVHSEYVVNAFTHTQDVSAAGLSRGLANYETASLSNKDAVLTKLVRAGDDPQVVPNTKWKFADCSSTPFPGVPSTTHVCLEDGFDPNYIYELTYTAKNPRVLGIGFAASRDLVAFFRYKSADDSGQANPLRNKIRFAIAHGTSQSANYLRTFLLLGFNQSEKRKRVFDGMNLNVTSRHLALNVRFGQPGRGACEHVDHRYPGFDAPLSWAKTTDEISGRTGGILDRCERTRTCPRIFHILSSTEYWQQRGSTNTTDALGKRDLPIPQNVRIYLIASTQHSSAVRPTFGISQQLSNPNPERETLRALLVALEEWTTEEIVPPPSSIPRLRDKTLTLPDAANVGWPRIPDVTYTGLVNDFPLIDWGPKFRPTEESGIAAEPPVLAGKQYSILVPKVDADGNEVAGIRTTAVQAPVGTYTGWNLRREGFSKNEMTQLTGSYIPFSQTRKERLSSGDPRPSIEERYRDHAGYVAAVRTAARRLERQKFLLPEDARRLVREAEASAILR